MHRIKKLTAVILSTLTVSSVCVFGGLNASASGTGAGLAEYALNAYYEGWDYVWGGTEPGGVDCSGLIWSYCGGNRMSMLSDAQENGRDWGYVDDGIPRVHGLGLARPGHVGVYIEDNMEVDARGSAWGVCYDEIGGWNGWDCWFKLTAVSYPNNGWEEFNGNYYYYEDGEYIVSTSREIDGTTYYFDSKGHSSQTPSDDSADYSEVKKNSSSSDSSSSTPSVYKLGSKGDEVEKIQQRLTELGFYAGAIDGDFGSVTEQAYRAFQEAAGVLVDGIAGSDREVLYSDDAPSVNKSEDKTEETATEAENEESKAENTEEMPFEDDSVAAAEDQATEVFFAPVQGDFTVEVLDMQQKLYDLGYFGLEPTGFFGDITAEAIAAFQLNNGLEVTGELDEATFALLESGEAAANPTPVYDEEEAEEVAEPTPMTSELSGGFSAATASEAVAPVQNTTSAGESATNSAKSAGATNRAAEKALQNSASIIPDAQTAQVKRSANIWLWLVLTIIIISAVSLIFLRKTTVKKKDKFSKKNKTNTRAQLNTRW